LSQEQVAEYKETFALFDKNGDGTISSAEIGLVLKRTTGICFYNHNITSFTSTLSNTTKGRKPTQAEVARLTKNVDKDRMYCL
jgi:Ca2+-binding EF-hand superfamily protein